MSKGICKNPWCRGAYTFEGEMPPGECPKCKSFNKDTSGGVSWATKTFNDPKYDGAHSYDISQFASHNRTKYYGS
jgi:hypothetical protein